MKILLDECLDWRLARSIPVHNVSTARGMGWSSVKNGELLKLAVQAGFEVFVTVDRNLSFQQNITAYEIAVIVLRARSNRLTDLSPLVTKLLTAVAKATPGSVSFVGAG